MKICQLTNSTEKQAVTRSILEALPEWFGIPEAREDYITESGDKQFFCAYDADKPVGFLYLKETGKATVELYVMGVLKEYHRQGIGRELFQQAREAAGKAGYSFMQVKTVQMEDMRNMTVRTGFTCRSAFRNLRYFQHYGMNGIPVRYT